MVALDTKISDADRTSSDYYIFVWKIFFTLWYGDQLTNSRCFKHRDKWLKPKSINHQNQDL